MKHICDEKGCRLVPDVQVKLVKSKFLRNIFDQNTYVVLGEKEAVVIDAGAEVEDIKAVLGERKVVSILMTHLHFDHIWNLQKYTEYFDCPVYVKANEEYRLEDKNLNVSFMIKKEIKQKVPKDRIKYFENRLKIGEFDIEIFETPGHSKDAVCIKIDDNLFTGDTVFENGVGRFDFEDSSLESMISSLKLVQKINYETAYPGHYGSATKSEIDDVIKDFLGEK